MALLAATPSFGVLPTVVFNGVFAPLSTGSVGLNQPAGIAVDSDGNVFIADTAHNQIVKVTSTGVASALVLSGLSTALSAPAGLALDDSGNLFIADTGNNRVVQVNGETATVVALGAVTLASPQGVATDFSGNLFISDTGNNRIVKLPAGGGAAAAWTITGLGTALNAPAGLATDTARNVYVADSGNNRIVKITSGGAASALSISGLVTALAAPLGVALDVAGNLSIADSGNNRVVSVTSGGAGSALNTGSVTLSSPAALALGSSGALYIADTANSRVITAMTSAVGFGHVQLQASSGASLTLPFTISGGITLGDVQVVMLGAATTEFTAGAGTTCANGTTNTTCTVDITFLPAAPGLRRGAVVFYDQSHSPLSMLSLYGTGDAPLTSLSPGAASVIGSGSVSLSSPFQSAMDGAGNIYVGNYTSNTVTKIPAGGSSATQVSTGAITLGEVTGVAVDGAGNLFIADYSNSRIVSVTVGGTATVLSVSGLSQAISLPTALAIDAAGNLWIADYGLGRIVRVTPSLAASVVSTGSYVFSSTTLTGLAVDGSGNIYVADRNSNAVLKITPAGVTTAVSTPGFTLTNPQGVAVDGAGNLYIADSGHRRVVEVTRAGVVSVVQTPGLAIGTIIFGVTADSAGNLIVADWANNRLVQVDTAASALAFADTNLGATSTDSPKTVTVTNLGTQALVFASNPDYSADFSENSAGASLCAAATSLAVGETCNVSVNFTPQSVGSLSHSIVVTDNSLNLTSATHAVAASGQGINAAPAVTLASSANPGFLMSSVVLTATVSSGTGTPTGTVSFHDGTTLLGSATLSAGVATFAISSLDAGTHSLTATYGGDGTFLSAGSTALQQVITDLALAMAETSNVYAAVSPGGTATFRLAVGPEHCGTFPGAVTLSASGAPAGSLVNLSPQTLPAGSAATEVTLTVVVPLQTAANVRSRGRWAANLALAPLMGALFVLGSGLRRRRGRGAARAALLLLVLASLAVLVNCGYSPPRTTPQTRSHTITVNANAGALSRSTTVTLVVQ